MNKKTLLTFAAAATLFTSASVAEELLVGWDLFDDPVSNSAANVQNSSFTGNLTTAGTVTRGGFGSLNNTYGDLDATAFPGVSDSSSSAGNYRVILNNNDDVATFSITNGNASAFTLNQFAFDARTSDKFEGSTLNAATAYELWHDASSALNGGADSLINSFTIAGQADQQFSFNISSLGNLASGQTAVFYIQVAGANGWTNSVDNIGITGTAVPEPGSFALLGGLCALTAVALRRRAR